MEKRSNGKWRRGQIGIGSVRRQSSDRRWAGTHWKILGGRALCGIGVGLGNGKWQGGRETRGEMHVDKGSVERQDGDSRFAWSLWGTGGQHKKSSLKLLPVQRTVTLQVAVLAAAIGSCRL